MFGGEFTLFFQKKKKNCVCVYINGVIIKIMEEKKRTEKTH